MQEIEIDDETSEERRKILEEIDKEFNQAFKDKEDKLKKTEK